MADDGLSEHDTVDVAEWAADLTYREAHLFVEGFFDGFRHVDPRYGKAVQGAVTGDSWYYKGGFVIGWTLKALLLIAGGATLPAIANAGLF